MGPLSILLRGNFLQHKFPGRRSIGEYEFHQPGFAEMYLLFLGMWPFFIINEMFASLAVISFLLRNYLYAKVIKTEKVLLCVIMAVEIANTGMVSSYYEVRSAVVLPHYCMHHRLSWHP